MIEWIDMPMVPLLVTFVPGAPKTKGSLTFKGNGYVRENVVGSTRWRMMVVDRARAAVPPGMPAWSGPVAVHATFFLPAPAKYAGWLEAIWPRAGDVDKLTRNVLDALSVNEGEPKLGAGIYVDDNQVTQLVINKIPVLPHSSAGPGVDLRVYGIRDVPRKD